MKSRSGNGLLLVFLALGVTPCGKAGGAFSPKCVRDCLQTCVAEIKGNDAGCQLYYKQAEGPNSGDDGYVGDYMKQET